MGKLAIANNFCLRYLLKKIFLSKSLKIINIYAHIVIILKMANFIFTKSFRIKLLR